MLFSLLSIIDEREAVQKKTFTKWVNSILARVSCRITDLYLDLRDGRMLIKLLEVLSGERLVSIYSTVSATEITGTHCIISFNLSAQANQRPNAHPLSGECGQSFAVSKGTEGSLGEHGITRYCRWESPPHPGPHLDHHPSLPGQPYI